MPKELITVTYKGVTINEVWNYPKTDTLFESNLKVHNDPSVHRNCGCFGDTLEMCKTMIDERLKELNITEYKP